MRGVVGREGGVALCGREVVGVVRCRLGGSTTPHLQRIESVNPGRDLLMKLGSDISLKK